MQRLVRAAVGDRVYVTQGIEILPPGGTFRKFQPRGLEYYPFANDFGPFNLSVVLSFVEQLDQELAEFPNSIIMSYSYWAATTFSRWESRRTLCTISSTGPTIR